MFLNSTFINSPLEQFEVTNLIGINAPILGYLNITLSNLGLYSILVLLFANMVAGHTLMKILATFLYLMFNIFKSIRATHTAAAGAAVYATWYALFSQLEAKDSGVSREDIQALRESLVIEQKKNLELYQELNRLVTENEVLSLENDILREEKLRLITFIKNQMIETNEKISRITVQLENFQTKFADNENLVDVAQETVIKLKEVSHEIKTENDLTQKALDLWNSHFPKNPNFWDGNIFENFKSFLNQLNFEQLNAIYHIFSSVFILLLLINIITIIYSDYLLVYLKIEEKFPRLGRLIRIRRKFQQYYLITNILLIIITLIATIYIDFAIFTR